MAAFERTRDDIVQRTRVGRVVGLHERVLRKLKTLAACRVAIRDASRGFVCGGIRRSDCARTG